MRILMVICISVVISGCLGSTGYYDEPNAIRRASILSKNKNSISIRYSHLGTKIAYRLAEEHCRMFGKVATFTGSSQKFILDPDMIGNWRCEN